MVLFFRHLVLMLPEYKALSQPEPKKGRLIQAPFIFILPVFSLVEKIAQANLEHPALASVQICVIGFCWISVINLDH